MTPLVLNSSEVPYITISYKHEQPYYTAALVINSSKWEGNDI